MVKLGGRFPCAGQRDDAFYGDIGAIFDLLGFRKAGTTGNKGGGNEARARLQPSESQGFESAYQPSVVGIRRPRRACQRYVRSKSRLASNHRRPSERVGSLSRGGRTGSTAK